MRGLFPGLEEADSWVGGGSWSSKTAGGGVGAAPQGIWAEKSNQGACEPGLDSVWSGSGPSGG